MHLFISDEFLLELFNQRITQTLIGIGIIKKENGKKKTYIKPELGKY